MSTVAEPLNALTKKRTRMEWGYEADCAMEELKKLYDKHKDWWSGKTQRRPAYLRMPVMWGWERLIEQQNEDGNWLTVAAWSKKLSTSQQNYSATDKEWLAVVESVSRVWRHWLLGKEFTIRTDHAALREILDEKGRRLYTTPTTLVGEVRAVFIHCGIHKRTRERGARRAKSYTSVLC